MSLKKFIENQDGFTYTLEAILGVFLIMGTVMFVANNLPSVAHNTGDFSKVQLVNIGRDTLDLIAITPVYETCPDCLEGIVDRDYLLEADKTFVTPGDIVKFTVHYLNNTILDKPLTLEQTVCGKSQDNRKPLNQNPIIGTMNWIVPPDNGNFCIRAVDPYNAPISWSNYVKIKVGYYFLDTDTFGIFQGANDTNVSGVVYNSSGGIPNLDINLYGFVGGGGPNANDTELKKTFPTITQSGKIIETFDDANNWSWSTNTSASNDFINKRPGSIASTSINSTSSSFWIEKNIAQNLSKFDILSFYFYPQTGNERIKVELWNGIQPIPSKTTESSATNNWSKINTWLNISEVTNIDAIRISVTNINNSYNYLFDDMTVGEGKFIFQWPSKDINNKNINAGTYYFNATDGKNSSNTQRLIFSDKTNGRLLLPLDSEIFETMYVDLYQIDKNGILQPFTGQGNAFFIDNIKYVETNSTKLELINNNYIARFTFNTAGTYTIHFGQAGQQENADGSKTNSVNIIVDPLVNKGPTGDNCVDKDELNRYMKRYIPPYVNYNLYLIDSKGNRFTRCPKFEDGELINGYPTAKAVAVNKILHLKYRDIDNILELRMVLWYK